MPKIPSSPPAALAGIDLEAGLERLGGDWELFKTVLLEFAAGHGRICHEIREALAAGDRVLAGRLAHTLKGLAATLEATNLVVVATDLDAAFKRGAEEIEPLLQRVAEPLEKVLEAARQVESAGAEAGVGEADGDEPDPARTAALLARLDGLLYEHNLEAEECLAPVRRQLRGAGVDEAVERLERQVARFDFGGARATLAEVARALAIPLGDPSPR
jgi:two-component system sensor histidine kinase/response regulator